LRALGISTDRVVQRTERTTQVAHARTAMGDKVLG
jgi:hypothetical protein